LNLLKIVSEQNNNYLIDGFSNEIYQLNTKKELEEITREDIENYKSHQSLIPDDYEYQIRDNAKTLILEITEQCNLRCTYCLFDESYENERDHSSFTMTKEIAFKAIDNYKSRVDNKEAYIVFYGGEPLIRYDFIQDIVEYAKNIFGSIIHFSFTTNAVYLTQEKIEFLKDNNFLITISLDGNEKIHNKYRLDKNHIGSFYPIMQNIEYIYDNYQEYYKKFIQINCVVNSVEDFNELNQFFSTNKFVKDIDIRFTNQLQNTYELSSYITNNFTKKYILALIKSNNFKNHPLEYRYYSELIKKIKYRLVGEEAKNRKGKCIPFAKRTYVRANGKAQFCERVENMGLTSIDTEKMIKIADLYLKEYQDFIEKKCNSCFAYNYCEMCYASFVKNNELNKEIADIKCNNFQNKIKIAFEIYIDLMEIDEKLLEQF